MSSAAAPATTRLDFEQIRELLPHRFPMILLDRVIHLEPGSHIVALKNVTGNEMHFLGHFPGLAIMPGVLLIETAAQAAGILWAFTDSDNAAAPSCRHYLAKANVSFHAPVTPGDQLRIKVEVRRRLGAFFVASVSLSVEETPVARGEITLARAVA